MSNANGYYIAPNKRGRNIKIVIDVPITGQYSKLSAMGYGGTAIVKQALIARFVNEEECSTFLRAYEFFEKYGKFEKMLEEYVEKQGKSFDDI